jgi:hypothetical protein
MVRVSSFGLVGPGVTRPDGRRLLANKEREPGAEIHQPGGHSGVRISSTGPARGAGYSVDHEPGEGQSQPVRREVGDRRRNQTAGAQA